MTYTEALARFLKLATERSTAHYAKELENLTPPTFEVHPGRIYDKIVEVDSPQPSGYVSRRSYCYIEKATGNILKGCWKGVVKPKVARGNIYNDDNPLEGTTLYGTVYLR